MAVIHGKGGKVMIGGNTGASIVSWSMSNGGADFFDNTPLQTSFKTFLAGQRGATGSIECDWDQADTNVQNALLAAALAGTAVTLLLYISGSNYFSVPAYITVGADAPITGMVTRTFNYRSSGTVSFN